MREDEAVTKSGGTGLMMAGIVIAGVIAAGFLIGFRSDTGPSEEDLAAVVAPGSSVPATPETETAPTSAEDTPAGDSAEGAAVEQAETPEVSTESAASAQAPSIDEVRLEDDGLTVIAGNAAPGATVSVLVDGVEVATTVADGRGDFAAVAVVEPSDAARVLTLKAESEEATIASAEDVILAPVAKPAETAQASEVPKGDAGSTEAEATPPTSAEIASGAEPAPQSDTADVVARADPPSGATPADQPTPQGLASETQETDVPAAPGPNEDVAALVTPEDTVVEPSVDDAPASPPETASETPSIPEATAQAEPKTDPETTTQSVTVLKSTADGVELLQPDSRPAPNVAIDTIGYSDTGDVQLAGRAVPGTFEVRVYLNNRFVASIPVNADGSWRGTIADVAAGVYSLRVDEMNTASVVTSRIETPFKREAPAVLAEATEGQDGPVTAVTVQTGDTLWAIARDRYGEGPLYVRVFEANIAAIRDPDLIYPGQVFDLPVE
ncbi:LysM peptidoglycan-binding domain-containing protein [uncultured Roseobacter sp.]|uniref:LysM peptidoglycan-binding domain-containing protein n=1 Tax=uncultured Roseobacter sp. TaxID=114847 RepID=UPI0026157A5C|nr:LysM peptidoglycan-binding domain-containing protein [uncultured Roseobacter sp.]